ncbi:MAG: ABC transporter ATP-binding protein [Rubrivivax sp.]
MTMPTLQRPSPASTGSPTATSALLQAEALGLRVGTKAILHDVSVTLKAGDVVGLVGRNGAGKSSLLRCLVGLTPPSSGCSSLFGHDSLHLPDAARERLGYVSQQGDLLGWLDVWGHVRTVGAFYRRWSEPHARRLCERLELPLATRVDKLSGGEQQKLALVLALAHDPDLLILDEPVASLDPLSRRDFMRLLFEADGPSDRERPVPRTVLISSHLLQDLERVVTHVVFLHQGRLVLQGAWDALQEAHGQTMEDIFLGISAGSPAHTAEAAQLQRP